ncbi:diuretic hormone class 2 [Neodiprion virginianus]|uniref:diuretic hormone class 2 n=1 Tax=Neodiprion fabricii TaxID=2872261 RepID=UPI001ED92E75|nr:diuretic hormone class 2 [Neodiprion fabricii]XP_046609130.1 diuretic hormone class 2 [Neodiprion virginianus]
MQRQIAIVSLLLSVAVVFMLSASAPMADAAPYTPSNYYNQLEEEDPEVMLEMLARLGQSLIRTHELENSKRGLDLGLSRGFSGSQAAKHLMGLAAANYAGGPGRRRRSEQA